MKNINLNTKKNWLLDIVSGKKTEDYRDFTDYYIDRLCVIGKDGEIASVNQFETVTFVNGYKTDRLFAKVECLEVLTGEVDIEVYSIEGFTKSFSVDSEFAVVFTPEGEQKEFADYGLEEGTDKLTIMNVLREKEGQDIEVRFVEIVFVFRLGSVLATNIVNQNNLTAGSSTN